MSEVIPAPLFEAIKAFLRDGKTGQIQVNINSGRVESFDIRERCRLPAPSSVARHDKAC